MSSFAASQKRLFSRTSAIAEDTPSATSAEADRFEFEAELGTEEVSEEELLEFLAADLDPVPADPAFREKLRDDLWEMVADGRAGRRRDH